MDTIVFRCAGCQRMLELPGESAGKKFRCPECNLVGLIPAASEVATAIQAEPEPPKPILPRSPDRTRITEDEPLLLTPRGEEDDRVRRSGRRATQRRSSTHDRGDEPRGPSRDRLRAWGRVCFGINLVYWSLCVWVLTVIGFVVMTVLFAVTVGGARSGTSMGLGAAQGAGILWVILLVGFFLVTFAVDIASLVGYCFCIFVPPQTGALGWAIAAVGLAVLAGGIKVMAIFVPLLMPVAFLVNFAQWVAFLLFLRTIGLTLDVSWLVQSIQSLLFLAIGGVGACLAMFVGLAVAAAYFAVDRTSVSSMGPFACGMALAELFLLLLLVVILFRYLAVLRDTAAQIEEEMAARGQVLTGAGGNRPREL